MKVFISHSSQDKRFVRLLKDCLLENSIDVWFDEDQLDLGDELVPKLESALSDSSHLVIVLSPASINSEWVKFELKKALLNQRTGLIQKIIPIKYRECEVPIELSDLLYGDLSKEVVLPTQEMDKVRFISNGFDSFFLKLVKALRNTAKAISDDEKKEIIKAMKSSEKQIEKHAKEIHRGIYQLIGYESQAASILYQKLLSENSTTDSVNSIRPIHLPASIGTNLNWQQGDRIIIENDLGIRSFGHFAGHRLDDLKIAIDKRTRMELLLTLKIFYQVEIDIEKKIIRFVNNSELNPYGPFSGNTSYAMAA